MTSFLQLGTLDSLSSIPGIVTVLLRYPPRPPAIYLSVHESHGSAPIITLLIHSHTYSSRKVVYLMDIQTMGDTVFTIAAPSDGGPAAGKTLKDVFESPEVPKVVFGGNVVDLLKGYFGMEMKGVIDLQNMALGNVAADCKEAPGQKSLEIYIMELENITATELESWRVANVRGKAIFAPTKGEAGETEVARKRPFENDVMLYCLGEVQYLPALWEFFDEKLREEGRVKIVKA